MEVLKGRCLLNTSSLQDLSHSRFRDPGLKTQGFMTIPLRGRRNNTNEKLLRKTFYLPCNNYSEILVNIELNASLLRLAIVVEILNSICIVFLAVMLYTIFKNENKILSLVAFGWWIIEVAILSVMVIGLYGLIPLSQQYVEAGAPESSHFLALAHFLYYGIYDFGFIVHNVFFAMGGVLWYYQFYKSSKVPKVLGLWGLISICLFTVYCNWVPLVVVHCFSWELCC